MNVSSALFLFALSDVSFLFLPFLLRPEFSLLVEPPAGDPEYLIAEIKLPGVVRHTHTQSKGGGLDSHRGPTATAALCYRCVTLLA